VSEPRETARQIAERIVYALGCQWEDYAAAVDDEHRDHEKHVTALEVFMAESIEQRVASLTADLAQARQEIAEAHAMLTGKGEMVWIMTHPDGVPVTELGKAVERLHYEADQRKAQLTAAEQARDEALKALASKGGPNE